MQLNELITEGMKTIIEGKNKEKQQTSVHYGGDKATSMKDSHVSSKAQSDLEGGLKGDIDKKNKNPQGEGGKDAIQAIQKHPNLGPALVAGIFNAKAKKGKSSIGNFKAPAPATK